MHPIKEPFEELIVDPPKHVQHLCLPDARSLRIYDTTLRDGEQTPGLALSPGQKYRLAEELSAIGCHVLDLCFPVTSEEEHELLRLTAEGKRQGKIRQDLEISVMCRAHERDIDATIDVIRRSGFELDEIVFLIFTSSSPLHVKYKLGRMLLKREGVNPDELFDAPLSFFHQANQRLVREMIGYARQKGVSKIEFGGEDSSRTPLPMLVDMARTAIDAGAFRYIFADTTGCLTPEATRYYCGALTEALPEVERVSHFHDDFNLATINTITAALHGFTTMTTTVNGIGERAGNTPMHSVVVALRYLYGLEIPGFQYDRLTWLKRFTEELTGMPVAAKEPVIGRNVFTHESGIHTHGVSISRRMYEVIPAEEVGGVSHFVYGKHTGTTTLVKLLEAHQDELGCELDDALIGAILCEVHEERAERVRRNTTPSFIEAYYRNLDSLGFQDDEVMAIARRVTERVNGKVSL